MWRYVPSTMLLAASESAVTKKPRLRFTMSRSSSVNPLGSFHRAMSRFMFTSCGIQWLAQPAMYFSQAHLYLNGTSWFTSVRALMTRLSSARTRVWPIGAEGDWGGADLAGSSAGEVRPDGVEWMVCRPTLSAAIGVSSSKLSILNRLQGLAVCERHFLCLLVFVDRFEAVRPSGGGFRLRYEAGGQSPPPGGPGLPGQRPKGLGAGCPPHRRGKAKV